MQLLLWALVVLGTAIVHTTESVMVGFSDATLLSGDVADCSQLSSVRCRRGLAGVAHVVRQLERAGNNVTVLPYLDRQSEFVQQHPLSWGINTKFFERYSIKSFLTKLSLFTEPEREGFELMRNESAPLPFVSNALISPASRWFGFFRRSVIQDGVGILNLESDAEPNSVASVDTAVAAIGYLSRFPSVDVVVLLSSEHSGARDPSWFVPELHKRGAFPQVVVYTGVNINATELNGTHVVGAKASSGVLSIVDIEVAVAGLGQGRGSLRRVELNEYSIDVPVDERGSQWAADQAWNSVEAKAATQNDPIIGYTTAMPLTRDDGDFRACMGGECPLGALFTNAMRWKISSDVAFTPSGGTRGPGWPAGAIRVSDTWAALPFANRVCSGHILGLRLWEMLNYSYGVATFSTANSDFGDRLLQVSGMRIVYNSNLSGSRIQTIEVYNRRAGQYEPLQRRRLYSWAADDFLCEDFVPFNAFLLPFYEGESQWTMIPETLQEVVREFLTNTTTIVSPYNTSIEKRMIDSSKHDANPNPARFPPQAPAVNWTQTPASCRHGEYWFPGHASCVSCEPGFIAASRGSTKCVLQPRESSSLPVTVGVPIASVAAVIAIAFGVHMYIQRRKNVRNVNNAPKSGSVVLIFTDIESSTKLWSTCPTSMAVALDTHHQVIRQAISLHHAYEVKTAGDAFMIAASSCASAAALTRDIQLGMQSAVFPKSISEVYEAHTEDELDNIVDNATLAGDPLEAPLWNGLRVRVGIHVGNPEIVYDEVAKGYDYYGPVANLAARIESVADGGQVCLSREVEIGLPDADREGMQITHLGAVELKGISTKTDIFGMVPTQLKAREFDMLQDDELGVADDHNASITSLFSVVQDEKVVMATRVLHQMVKLMQQKEKRSTIVNLVRAWRVSTRGRSENEVLDAIGRRIGKSMKITASDSFLLPAVLDCESDATSVEGSPRAASKRRKVGRTQVFTMSNSAWSAMNSSSTLRAVGPTSSPGPLSLDEEQA